MEIFIVPIAVIVFIIILLLRVHHINSGVKKIIFVLQDIHRGNSSRRIHMRVSSQHLQKLGSELNSLMDTFNETLERKQYLESSHKKLISNISHDIRTPLTSLLGYAEALQNDFSLSEDEQRAYLNIILAKGRTLYYLIQQFFELSKLESDDTSIKHEKVNICEKVSEAVASFYQDLSKEGICPEIIMPDIPVYVWGDHIGILRVFQNLISNVLKYGKDGKIMGIEVKVESDRVWVEV